MQPTKRPFLAIVSIAAACLAAAACSAGAAELAGTNLVLVTVDTLRADHVGAWGHPHDDTPAIDRLAAEGVRFARALAPAPTTLPTHASILTGATPPRHGIRDNSAGLLSPTAVTLAELLRDRGYATGAFVGAYVLDARWGLDQGFDVYDDPAIPDGVRELRLAEAERRGDEVLEAALEWIGSRDEGPWFAWIHFYDPHAPYRPPPPWDASHADRRYDGEIAWIDSLVGRLRRTLESAGSWSDTSLILTSDHGEALGEHDEPTHGFFVYEESLHVPLIVRPAEAAGVETAGVVTTPVALIDLFPTVVELWGLEPAVSQGRSLAGALRGAEIAARPVYSETFVPRLHFGWQELYAISDGDERFIEAPEPELYDLETDPDESINLADARPGRVEELRAELRRWLDAAGPERSGVGLDTERIDRLRSLGYLSVGGSGAGDEELADPKDRIDVYNRVNEAMSRWQRGEIAAALAELEAIGEELPEFAGAHHFRGQILLAAGRTEEAVAAFRTALEIDPDHELAARELLRLHLARGEREEAEALLAQLVADHPTDASLRRQLAGLMLAAGRPDEAEALLRAGLEIDPEAAPLHVGLGRLALARGRPEEALAALDRAAAIDPDAAGLQAQRGVALARLERHGDALRAFRAATADGTASFETWMNLALSASRLGLYEQAIAALRTALELRPSSGDARLFLAQALLDLDPEGNLDEAQELAETGIAATPSESTRALGHLTLARIYEARGRPEDAAAQRREAERLRRR